MNPTLVGTLVEIPQGMKQCNSQQCMGVQSQLEGDQIDANTSTKLTV